MLLSLVIFIFKTILNSQLFKNLLYLVMFLVVPFVDVHKLEWWWCVLQLLSYISVPDNRPKPPPNKPTTKEQPKPSVKPKPPKPSDSSLPKLPPRPGEKPLKTQDSKSNLNDTAKSGSVSSELNTHPQDSKVHHNAPGQHVNYKSRVLVFPAMHENIKVFWLYLLMEIMLARYVDSRCRVFKIKAASLKYQRLPSKYCVFVCALV